MFLNRLVHFVILFCILALVPHSAVAGDTERRDGNWWIEQQTSAKVSWVIGFFDGMQLGNQFSYWGLLDGKDKQCAGPALDSYDKMSQKFLSNVTAGQLRDGLDEFYKDYRNRRIATHVAVWLVANGIAGTPKEKLEGMVESWRKNSIN